MDYFYKGFGDHVLPRQREGEARTKMGDKSPERKKVMKVASREWGPGVCGRECWGGKTNSTTTTWLRTSNPRNFRSDEGESSGEKGSTKNTPEKKEKSARKKNRGSAYKNLGSSVQSSLPEPVEGKTVKPSERKSLTKNLGK